MAAPGSTLKRSRIFAFSLLSLSHVLALVPRAWGKSQDAQARVARDLSVSLEAAMAARNTGDPAAIGPASQRVIALALVQMAKIRLDEKAYNDAVRFCRDSLEFQDTPEIRLELAIADLYARKSLDAVKQASAATDMDPQNALAWTIKGESLLQEKDYPAAAVALARALDLKRDAESLYALGMAYLGMGEKQKAAESFSEMLSLAGDSGWTRVAIGKAYQEQNLPQDAVMELQTALRLDPRTPNAHYFWALTLLQANDWLPTPEVRSHAHEELKLNPRHFLANYLLAIFARMDRDFDESDRYFHIAAELNPSLPEIWMYLGLNANARNASPSAEVYLLKAIALRERGNSKENLSFRQAYYVLGRILLSSGRKKEGEALIRKAQELEDLFEMQGKVATPKTKDGADMAGAVVAVIPETDNQDSFSLGSAQAATDGDHPFHERLPLSQSPHDPAGSAERQLRAILGSSFNDLATAEALQEKYDLALKHYREAGNWDPGIPGLQRNLGLAAYFAGRPDEAVQLLSKVVKEMPGDAHVRAVLGMAYFATAEYPKAARTIAPIEDRALQDPQLGFAWAKSLAQIGNKKGAAHALQSLDKSNANLSIESLIQFGKLWQELGETERAAQFFRRALVIDPGNADAKCALHLAECP